MVAIGRRRLLGHLLIGASALALGACGGAGGATGPSPDDMALGSEDAPVTLIEYASAICPACAAFHERMWDQLKAEYIDTGRVRFIYREYPTNPAPVAVAGFQLARCGGATPEQYFVRLGEFYRQQPAMFSSLQAGSMDGVRRKIVEIGTAAGLSEDQVLACISDEAGADRVRRIVEAGNREFNITGTPTLIINGRTIETPQTFEALARQLDEAGA
jgi:protein-disulfide isomerase